VSRSSTSPLAAAPAAANPFRASTSSLPRVASCAESAPASRRASATGVPQRAALPPAPVRAAAAVAPPGARPAADDGATPVAVPAEGAPALQPEEPAPCQEPQLSSPRGPSGAPRPTQQGASDPGAPVHAGAAQGMRRSLIGYQGPLHQHQHQRSEEEQARWAKVSSMVQGLLRLLEEQEARVAQLEAANAAAAERIAHHEAAVERNQQEQQAAVGALSDSVKALLQQGRALLRHGSAPSPERSAGGRPGSAAPSEAGGSTGLDPSMEEFMEATSGCLQLHEKRLDELQVGPKRARQGQRGGARGAALMACRARVGAARG
jgi:hypothetical protein